VDVDDIAFSSSLFSDKVDNTDGLKQLQMDAFGCMVQGSFLTYMYSVGRHSRRSSSSINRMGKPYAYGFKGRELESIGVSPVCKFIETLLEVTLDNVDTLRSVAIRKSSTYKEHSTPWDIALTIELMFNPNRVTERILP